MSVIIGSARLGETGARNQIAGDQSGKEVSTQNWYKHAKGWVVLRPKNATHAEKIAKCMEMACANDNIGYDQADNLTLYNAAKPFGFDVSKVNTKVETDCSALVRVCLAYAGITVARFATATQITVLMNTGLFEKYTDANYVNTSDYLKRGDILVTPVSGHTVVVLTNGSKITQQQPQPQPVQNTDYIVGKTYTLQSEMNVRVGAGTNYGLVGHNKLTSDGKLHDINRNGALDKGTKITVLEVKKVGKATWLRCPSGWICAIGESGKVYVQ